MGELYRPPQFHSQNREYFGVFGPVNFGQTVDGTVVIELEKSAFRDIECDSCGTSASRPLSLRFLLCAGERLSSANLHPLSQERDLGDTGYAAFLIRIVIRNPAAAP